MAPLYEQKILNATSDIPEFQVVSEINEDVATVTVGGDFDSYFCHYFTRAVEALHKHYDDFSSARIDLQNVYFIDSAALQTLINSTKSLQEGKKVVQIYNPSEVVKRILAISGLIDVVEIIEADEPDQN